jgi:hypothetical protein
MLYLLYVLVAGYGFMAFGHGRDAFLALRRSRRHALRSIRRRLWLEALGHAGAAVLWVWVAFLALHGTPR